MTQPVLREEKPPCFGRINDPRTGNEGWDPNCPQCSGGLDPVNTNPNNGSHVLDRCAFFNACGATVQAKKMEQSRQGLIDPRNLNRSPPILPPASYTAAPPPLPPPPAVSTPSYMQRFTENQQQLALQQEQQRKAVLQQQQYQQWLAQQQMPQGMPSMGYQQMMPVNYQMPAYLTAPEVPQPGGFWRMLGHTVVRSMGKSIGHSIAHLFDTVPFGGPKPPSGSSGGF